MTWRIADVSWGKDSTAMLHRLIEDGWPLDEVCYYDTGMEFPAIYEERDRTLPLLREHGIEYTELRPKNPMWWDMFCRPVRSRETGKVHKRGYGWCGGPCRWGTTAKTAALDRHAKERDAVVYVGIAADETARISRDRPGWKRLPLVEMGLSEADCLSLCYERGHAWEQDGVRLYDVLDRVSCWCCRNKNLKELASMRDELPDWYARLVAMEQVLGQMKSRPLERGE